jgi:MYXO-CTERM domain-containing protein
VRAPLPSTRQVEPTYHFILAEVSPTRLGFRAKRPDGTLIETCGFLKGGEWDCDKKHIDTLGAGLPPGDPVPDKKVSTPASPCGCRAVGTPSPPLASVGVGLLAALALIRRRVRRFVA